MTLQIGRRDHHHVVYHMDHGEIFGEGDAPQSVEQVVENVMSRLRNTGFNAINLHITGATRHFLGIAEYEQTQPPFKHLGHWNIYETIRHHRQNGTNLMEEIGNALHAQGIALWAGLRVNDIHHTTGKESAHPVFWSEHPEYRTNESVPWDHIRSTGALDFAHQAVRDYLRDQVDKTLELYDVDGIDLDFNRMAILFKSSEVDQHRDKVTEMLREIRVVVDAAAKRRGHPIFLEARVPSVAEQCYRMGADVLRWIDEEIIHVLTASPHRFVEFEMPLGSFLEASEGKETLILAGLEGSQADGVLNREMYRAWAYHYWKMGVDGLHLFNNCYNHILGGGLHPVDELHDPERLARLGKRYIVTRTLIGRAYSEISDPVRSYPKQLPLTLETSKDGHGQSVTINLDDDLEAAQTSDTLESLTLRLRVTDLTRHDKISVKVNGRDVPAKCMKIRGSGWGRRQIGLPYAYAAPLWSEDTSESYRWILCDLSREGHLHTGANQVEVILTEKNPDVLAPPKLYNVEIDVKYRDTSHEGNRDMGRF